MSISHCFSLKMNKEPNQVFKLGNLISGTSKSITKKYKYQ